MVNVVVNRVNIFIIPRFAIKIDKALVQIEEWIQSDQSAYVSVIGCMGLWGRINTRM